MAENEALHAEQLAKAQVKNQQVCAFLDGVSIIDQEIATPDPNTPGKW